MADKSKKALLVPTLEELRDAVTARQKLPETDVARGAARKSYGAPKDTLLTPLAKAFLRHAAEPGHADLSLEERWKAIGVRSGAVKSRILSELRRLGLVRLETKGRRRRLHLYNKAYELLGLPIPRGEGVGGATHRKIAGKMAKFCKECGSALTAETAPTPKSPVASTSRPDEAVIGKALDELESGPMPDDDREPTPATAGLAPDEEPSKSSYRIEVMSGPDTGKKASVSGASPVAIGSRDGVEIVVNADKMLSRRHASFQMEDGTLFVRDEGSTNGTLLQVQGNRPVEDGDTLILGNTLVRARKER